LQGEETEKKTGGPITRNGRSGHKHPSKLGRRAPLKTVRTGGVEDISEKMKKRGSKNNNEEEKRRINQRLRGGHTFLSSSGAEGGDKTLKGFMKTGPIRVTEWGNSQGCRR